MCVPNLVQNGLFVDTTVGKSALKNVKLAQIVVFVNVSIQLVETFVDKSACLVRKSVLGFANISSN